MSSEHRPGAPDTEEERRAREAGLDDTIAQTFPASDPPSTIPNPCELELVEEDAEDAE